jgi:hypothetical protein
VITVRYLAARFLAPSEEERVKIYPRIIPERPNRARARFGAPGAQWCAVNLPTNEYDTATVSVSGFL